MLEDARPPHVKERHEAIELFRPMMLQKAIRYRIAAMCFTDMLYQAPDDDVALDWQADQLRLAQNELVTAIENYRKLRDIQGIA